MGPFVWFTLLLDFCLLISFMIISGITGKGHPHCFWFAISVGKAGEWFARIKLPERMTPSLLISIYPVGGTAIVGAASRRCVTSVRRRQLARVTETLPFLGRCLTATSSKAAHNCLGTTNKQATNKQAPIR